MELTEDLKTNREESLTKHVGFVYAYAKRQRIEKLMMSMVATAEKAQESLSTIKNKTHFSLLVFHCDFEDALLILISLN